VLGKFSKLIGAERLQGHPTVFDAIICSGISSAQGSDQILLVRPVLLAGMSFVGLALARDDGLPVEASQAMYLMSRPPSLKDSELVRNMRKKGPAILTRIPGLITDITRPTPASDFVRFVRLLSHYQGRSQPHITQVYSLTLSLRRALQYHQEGTHFRDAEVEDIVSAHYACNLASLLVRPSSSLEALFRNTVTLSSSPPRSWKLATPGKSTSSPPSSSRNHVDHCLLEPHSN
jgi:hypothetical protein